MKERNTVIKIYIIITEREYYFLPSVISPLCFVVVVLELIMTIDKTILQYLPNQCPNHKSTIRSKELSFYGCNNQPDYGKISIEMIPNKKVPELKSVKLYLHQFRNIVLSYEKLLSIIYTDFYDVYAPEYLYVRIQTSIRGGISSMLEISS